MDDADMIVSYDFQQALEVNQRRLDNDTELTQRTQLSPPDLMWLCSLCLRLTVFTFREKLHAYTERLTFILVATYKWKIL